MWPWRPGRRRLAKLKEYKRAHGDCNVPQRWAADPRLGRWVTTQRQGRRNLDRDEPRQQRNGMTATRAAKLDALGFVWAFRVAAAGAPRRC
jgi:hypothetical protein